MGCHKQCWNGYNDFRTVQPDSFVEEAWPRHSSFERAALVANTCPADLQTADNSVLRDAWPSTGVSCWATGPAPPTSSVEVRFCRTILCHSRRPSGTVTAVSLWQWQLCGISCPTLLGWSRHCHFSEPIWKHIFLEAHFLKYSAVQEH